MKLTIDQIEQNELEVPQRINFPNNSVIFDIGCSYGSKTEEYINRLHGTDFNIHCFEPLPLQYIQETEKFGHLPNIHLNNIALSNQVGTLPFYWVESCPVLSGFDRQYAQHQHGLLPVKTIDVSVTTLDTYISEHNIKHIDWMKIDVEGGEFNILRGGEEMLKNQIVDIIQFEYGITWITPNIKVLDVINYVTQFNYTVCHYNNGIFTELIDFEEDYAYNVLYILNNKINKNI